VGLQSQVGWRVEGEELFSYEWEEEKRKKER
jgi:hypothetical protein